MIDQALKDAGEKMDKAVAAAKEDMATIRAGRANSSMFSKIVADYYGTPTPLQQLASFAVPEARMILVTPFDKSAVTAIEKAIRDSDLGVNPTSDGTVIRVTLPELTEDRRKEYIKQAKGKAEDAKIAVRNIRRTAKELIDKTVKDHKAGEDEGHRAEKSLDELTAKHVAAIDEILKHKEAELLEV
jgi:ribosome recycling factor